MLHPDVFNLLDRLSVITFAGVFREQRCRSGVTRRLPERVVLGTGGHGRPYDTVSWRLQEPDIWLWIRVLYPLPRW